MACLRLVAVYRMCESSDNYNMNKMYICVCAELGASSPGVPPKNIKRARTVRKCNRYCFVYKRKEYMYTHSVSAFVACTRGGLLCVLLGCFDRACRVCVALSPRRMYHTHKHTASALERFPNACSTHTKCACSMILFI